MAICRAETEKWKSIAVIERDLRQVLVQEFELTWRPSPGVTGGGNGARHGAEQSRCTWGGPGSSHAYSDAADLTTASAVGALVLHLKKKSALTGPIPVGHGFRVTCRCLPYIASSTSIPSNARPVRKVSAVRRHSCRRLPRVGSSALSTGHAS